MLNATVTNYLSTAKGLPFYYVVGDNEYNSTLTEFQQAGVGIVHISDFCKNPDKFPNIDDVVDFFQTADVYYKCNKYILVGLGEYLALQGEDEAEKILIKLKTTTLGVAKIILLLRHVGTIVERILADDLRMKPRVYISSGIVSDTSIINVKAGQHIGIIKEEGIQPLLREFEDGKSGKLYIKTMLDLTNSLIPITSIEDSYGAIKVLVNSFDLPKQLGDEEQWCRFLSDLQKYNYSINQLFETSNFYSDLEDDYIEKAFGYEYKNWLYFILLKLSIDKIKNRYLKYVIKRVDDFKDLKPETFNAIISVRHTEKLFKELYIARKKLIRNVSDSDISDFIRKNAIDINESIYRLTDNTLLERQAIIQWISEHGLIDELEQIYPALSLYLTKYSFVNIKNSDKLTKYFEDYKHQKICNKLDEGFEQVANESANLYTCLDTRANIILSMGDRKSTFLYWIDALGVEYLAYIQALAKKKGLSVHIDIARADLPTITSVNKAFYDEWDGCDKYKESRLDDIKHNDNGGFDFGKNRLPIYVAEELSIIEEAIDRAAIKLGLNSCKKFVIASDHGASRLAVLGQHDKKYKTDTKGEHSGRCCKYFDGYNIENAIAENGYVVLTDYGRFEGSREANLEVHGGGTLEETVIPIITLSLSNQADIDLVITNSKELMIDRKKGVIVSIYISFVENSNSLRMEINDAQYYAVQIDKTHYNFILENIKRASTYKASIFDGSNLIKQVELQIKGAVGSTKTDFDDLF